MNRWLSNLGERWDRWLEYSRARRQVEEHGFLESKNYFVPEEDKKAARERLRKATEARQRVGR